MEGEGERAEGREECQERIENSWQRQKSRLQLNVNHLTYQVVIKVYNWSLLNSKEQQGED